MTNFSELGIEPTITSFEGDKIKLEKVLDKPVVVHAYKIEPSKFQDKGNGNRLVLQLTVNDEKRILFTSSVTLMNMIEQVKESHFPFTSTIIKDNGRIKFS